MSIKNASILGVISIIVAIGLILANAEFAFGLLSSSIRLNSSGVITSVNLKVYWDSACTNPVTTIDWGMISPGASKSVQIYVKNIGNVPVTLSLSTENWNPSSANNYITLTWNYTSGTKIQPDNVLKVTLTLTVLSNVEGITNFSFNIIITGTESQ